MPFARHLTTPLTPFEVYPARQVTVAVPLNGVRGAPLKLPPFETTGGWHCTAKNGKLEYVR